MKKSKRWPRFPKRHLTLKRGTTILKIRCLEETSTNYWGQTEGSKLLRFPKCDWEVLLDEVQ